MSVMYCFCVKKIKEKGKTHISDNQMTRVKMKKKTTGI